MGHQDKTEVWYYAKKYEDGSVLYCASLKRYHDNKRLELRNLEVVAREVVKYKDFSKVHINPRPNPKYANPDVDSHGKFELVPLSTEEDILFLSIFEPWKHEK
jgi:hypothetical protein